MGGNFPGGSFPGGIFLIPIKLIMFAFNKISYKDTQQMLYHSHKKREDSLEGSLDGVLFAAELEIKCKH